jgi:hypothetical protein
MMSIGTRLTLLVLVLPICLLTFIDAISIYYYGILAIEVSNLLSSVLVFC